jgi:hypothetical protein
MATARAAAASLRRREDGLAWVCDLASHPVPTFVSRAPDGRLAVVEELPVEGRLLLARQAEGLIKLNHPNLGRVRSVSVGPKAIEVVTDYVKGEAFGELERLADEAHSPIPLEVKLRIVVDVLNGLSALHGLRESSSGPSASGMAAGLIHGNVRPENILVGLDGTTRLVRPLLPRSMAPNPYEAPELASSEGDARADLFSVGVVLERALSKAHSAEKAWAAPFSEVVARATQPSREARFATAAQMAAEVRKIAKAKLASPLIVAAAVEEMAGDRIDERAQRCESQAVPTADPSGTARIGSFPEEAPTVPRKPAPELLRPARPLPPLAKPKATPARVLPPPPPKAPAVLAPSAKVLVESPAPVEVPPPPPEIAVLATPLVAEDPAPVEARPAPLVAPVTAPIASVAIDVSPRAAATKAMSYTTEDSEAAVEIAIPEPPPVDVLLLPLEASATDPPLATTQLGRERTRKIVFGVLGVAVVTLVIAGVRSAARGQLASATAVPTQSPGEPVARAPLPPAIPPAPAPADPQATVDHGPRSVPPTVPVPEATRPPRPIAPADPTPAHASPSTSPAPSKKGPASPARPAATYDPLGI